jgi:hypothetical protein
MMPKKMNTYVPPIRGCNQKGAKPDTVDPARYTGPVPVPIVLSKKSASLHPTNLAIENFLETTKNIRLKRCGRRCKNRRVKKSITNGKLV